MLEASEFLNSIVNECISGTLKARDEWLIKCLQVLHPQENFASTGIVQSVVSQNGYALNREQIDPQSSKTTLCKIIGERVIPLAEFWVKSEEGLGVAEKLEIKFEFSLPPASSDPSLLF